MKKAAIQFIVLMGIISLFADVTYEGARSITGPFLSVLGASGAAVGLIVGIGEFIGYGMRFISGYLSDKTGKYWLITFIGYFINLFAVPLLAFAGSWQVAAFLIILERFGKSIRVPARDTLLSYATKTTGSGWGFGLHEALDQIGAVIGPLWVALVLLYKHSYPLAFGSLVISAGIALLFLILARFKFPTPRDLEAKHPHIEAKGYSKGFWLYIAAVSLVAAGYVDFALISYHFKKVDAVASDWIAFLYAIAMAVDGLAALFMGRLFDLKGLSILALFTFIGALFAPLVFLGGFYSALTGIILWGIGLGSQESIMRAVVADLVPASKRGSAYGVMHLSFGAFWAIGSAIMGVLYDFSILFLVIFSLVLQFAAIPIFLSLRFAKAK